MRQPGRRPTVWSAGREGRPLGVGGMGSALMVLGRADGPNGTVEAKPGVSPWADNSVRAMCGAEPQSSSAPAGDPPGIWGIHACDACA